MAGCVGDFEVYWEDCLVSWDVVFVCFLFKRKCLYDSDKYIHACLSVRNPVKSKRISCWVSSGPKAVAIVLNQLKAGKLRLSESVICKRRFVIKSHLLHSSCALPHHTR
jgi:hypothetical protein